MPSGWRRSGGGIEKGHRGIHPDPAAVAEDLRRGHAGDRLTMGASVSTVAARPVALQRRNRNYARRYWAFAVPASLIDERNQLVRKRDAAREELSKAKRELEALRRGKKYRSA